MTRAIIVCPDIKSQRGQNNRTLQARLEEAVNLSQAIHLDIVHHFIFAVQQIKPSTVIGSGQMEQVTALAMEEKVAVVVFDCTLTPMQQRNLEREIKAKVIDRNALILEIFGERAQTKEGKLQVELASLTYQKSRLVRSWTHLERQRGGVGFMGGPGESQIETDRRLIRDKIADIKQQLEKVVRTRALHRQSRDAVPFPTIALIGYTNAGKSTLFNRLTDAGVLAEDALFATLDPTTRRITLPEGTHVLLSDTVGFISNLPTQLIAAFRATLEEVKQADILLHVRDITHTDSTAQRDDVLHVLNELFSDAPDTIPPIIEVWNKCDAASEDMQREMARYIDNPVAVSAMTGMGIAHLLQGIEEKLREKLYEQVTFSLDASNGKAQAWIYQHGLVDEMAEAEKNQLLFHTRMSRANIARFVKNFGITPLREQHELFV
jgi:GTPase